MPQPSPMQSRTLSHLTCSHTFSAARSPFASVRIGPMAAHFPVAEQETIAPDMLAVRFQGSSISSQAQAALARLGARQVGPLNEQGAATFSIPHLDARSAAASMRNLPGVISAGPIIYRQKTSLPNDPDFQPDQQWDMYQINMPNAWSVTQGSSSITIAIIDTGYDTANPDLIGKVDKSIVFDKGTGAQDVGAPIEDKDGHGSDTSGIAAANTNNAALVAGTGWNVHLLEARVFPNGGSGAASNDIASAINWAVSQHARVISLSLGSLTADPQFEEPAVAAAIAHGVVVVAASGNENLNSVDFPAADPGVVAVGASAYCDQVKDQQGSGGYEYVASYSNYGPGLTLVAPGGDPDATQKNCNAPCTVDNLQWIENLDSLQGPFHETVSLFAGTSQATPHVAGVVALMVSKDPALTPSQALSILRASADNIGDSHQGAGRLNALSALNQTP
ncbi:MAG TPA: S8 family serine peptidase [Candidatus Eremiobacteraceae bacterium]|nr:S8 family serine peptidase [Candidatus Eremiobacteraceae bacterium]